MPFGRRLFGPKQGKFRQLFTLFPNAGSVKGNKAWCRQSQAGVSVKTRFSLDQFAGIDNIEVKGCQ